jgi:parvulin-like peptidyl-prolyl isomerase
MKKTFTVLAFLMGSVIFAQNIKEQLKAIVTIEDARNFVLQNQNLDAQLMNIIPGIYTDEFSAKLSNVKPGDIFSDIDFTYKIIAAKNVQVFRVSYIFLDGSKLSLKEIEKTRTKIIEEYNRGSSFTVLAKKYTMDSSPDGDLGWFSEGMMVPDFENAVKNHKQNEIFKVDVTDKKWYYIVLKTFEDKELEELSVLKVRTS